MATSESTKRNQWALLAVVGLLVVGLIVLAYLFRRSPPADFEASVQATTSALLTSIPTIAPTPRPKGEDYYRMYAIEGVTFDQLARDTERYERKIIPLAGRVLQVVENGNAAALRLGVDGNIDDVMLVQYPGYSKHRVRVDDNIRIYGTVLGRIDYETVLGDKVTAPAMTADWLQIVSRG